MKTCPGLALAYLLLLGLGRPDEPGADIAFRMGAGSSAPRPARFYPVYADFEPLQERKAFERQPHP